MTITGFAIPDRRACGQEVQHRPPRFAQIGFGAPCRKLIHASEPPSIEGIFGYRWLLLWMNVDVASGS